MLVWDVCVCVFMRENVPTPTHAYNAIVIMIVLLDYDRGCVCPATVPVR